MDASISEPGYFTVTVCLSAPHPVGAGAAEQARGLLAEHAPEAWLRPTVCLRPSGAGLDLAVVLASPDAFTARRRVIDGIRALLGMDGVFARWTVDARGARVTVAGPS